MTDPWQESLDLDDHLDDVNRSLRPFKRQNTSTNPTPFLRSCTSQSPNPQNTHTLPSHSPPRLIPGPAGTLQTAMLRRRFTFQNDETAPTQDFIVRAMEDQFESDDDFTRDPWLSAVQFIHLQGFTDGDGAIGVPLSVIKSRTHFDKVSQVVAIVKCCTLNGLGDMMVTLKDPTATIDATIHCKVLAKTEFGKDISVGAVIILQKVAVFSPSRSARYLNITNNNVVKVIPKDTLGSPKQNCSATAVKWTSLNSEGTENLFTMHQNPLSLSRERTARIANSLRPDGTRERSQDQQMAVDETTGHSCNSDINNKDQNADAQEESSSLLRRVANGSKEGTENLSTMHQNPSSLSRERTEGIMGSLRPDSTRESSLGQPMAVDATTRHSCNNDRNNEQNSAQEESSLLLQGVANGPEEATDGTDKNHPDEVATNEQLNASAKAGKVGLDSEGSQNGRAAMDAVNIDSSHASGNVKWKQLPQWTDEQLDELFTFD